ncbi:Prospero homeobox protein 2 [Manis javanica]|nr:Prospero homeobox protein 2 [Manis javanica]
MTSSEAGLLQPLGSKGKKPALFSSNLLKAYFSDVQFNRCITSQMIKWFSNFREFYYIQMEKFARQAISDDVTNPKMLVVLRDSELFRALNMHYNKGNDFEVPDCFLEIASLTLQEFFRAVSAGKDSDPSWKKPIYKIISKLDSDIPEIFKSSSNSQGLFRN